MVILRVQHKGKRYSENRDHASGGKAVGFGLAKVDNQLDHRIWTGSCPQNTDTADLDQSVQVGVRAACQKFISDDCHPCLVVRDQRGTNRSEAQRQRRLARARGAKDQ
jgi:hypothetical protein